METLRIGQVARRSGTSVEAIRYYERLGLVPEAPRTVGGYRQFGAETVRRILFIRRAQDLGFSLREIKELLDLRSDRLASAAEVRERARAKLHEIERKIVDLTRVRDALGGLIRSCHGRGTSAECPILDALDGSGRVSAAESAETRR